MYLKIFFVLLILSRYSDGQRDKKYFRKDYKYITETNSFYKIHMIHKTWKDAKRVCALEGANLFYPENTQEVHAVFKYWNDSNVTQPFQWVFIGISDVVAEGVFETIDGIPVSDVYSNWGPGEPNDANGVEDCVILRKDGSLNDDNCLNKHPFICKKSLVSLEWNQQCNIPNLDYVYSEETGKCYKFHLRPKIWDEAQNTCRGEQSKLAVINSHEEAAYLVRLTRQFIRHVPGIFSRGVVLLGFHNNNVEDWQTVEGTSLYYSGYACWGNNQPDGGERDRCGSMFYNGHLNDIACDQNAFFVCEHDNAALNYVHEPRSFYNVIQSVHCYDSI